MAAWEEVGTLQPGVEWASYPNEVLGGIETIRVTHYFTTPSSNPALLAQWFPLPEPGGIARILKLWPIQSGMPRIYTFPIPPGYREDGILIYTPLLKLGRFPHFDLDGWSIKLEAFYP